MRTPSDIIEQLARAPDLIDSLLETVPVEDLKRRPAPSKWSAHEHACHLVVMEPMWRARLVRILTEDNPRIVSYEPDDEDPDRLLNMELGPSMRAFRTQRAQLVSVLRGLPPEQWNRPATHTSHARYSLFLMCRHVAMHDLLHGYRIEESALGSHWPAP